MDCSEVFLEVREPSSALRLFVRTAHAHLPSLPDSPSPVIVLHGGPGLPHDYLLPIADMVQDRPVVFYDQLGCGRSSAPPNASASLYSIQKSVEDLHQLIEYLNFPSIILLGHSWGGMLAFEYLNSNLATSSKVTALILSNTSTSAALAQREIQRRIGELIMAGVPNESLDSEFRARYQCRVPSDLLGDTLRCMSRIPSWSGLNSVMKWEVNGSKLLDALRVLVIQGEHDFTPKCGEGWAAVAKDIQFEVIPESSHMPHIENPDAFRDVLLRFLSSLKADS